MAVEFIRRKTGAKHLEEARRQQKQLAYFTQSAIQEDITEQYLEEWANRNYAGNEEFLNWVKSVFRTQNFLAFYKYFRHPLPSSKLVNDIIKPQMHRVFFAEDSYFDYTIKGTRVQEPEELDCEHFNGWMFNSLFFRHNDILITDLRGINEPFRDLISIDNVAAIETKHGKIQRIAYSAITQIEGVSIDGFAYMDSERYAFYNKEYVLLLDVPHDLGRCPADFIAKEPFGNNDIVRKSIFSYVKTDLEEYVFLKTLQRMADANGTMPIVTKLKTREKESENKDFKGEDGEPMAARTITGQRSDEFAKTIRGSKSVMQAGSEISVPIVKKTDGSIDMEAVKNFVNFFYAPVEALKFMTDRINQVREEILSTVLGDLADQNGERKNELQVRGGFATAEDRLRQFGAQLSRIRKLSDYAMLALKYGPDQVRNDAFYGSDFFLDSPEKLYKLFEESPNPIERKNILIRISKNRNKFNHAQGQREVILYHLIPYVSDEDFKQANEKGAVDKINFQLQTRFTYWMGLFEAKYGDIVTFWNDTQASESEKIVLINRLLSDLIIMDQAGDELTEDEKTIKKLGEIPALVANEIVKRVNTEKLLSLVGIVQPDTGVPPPTQ